LEEITENETASLVFSEWATAVSELELDDGVKFQRFQFNRFWRRIDYAMSDDFPTVNTDIKCWVDGVEVEFGMDVSFNLDVEQPPVQLLYKPLSGKDFIVPLTVPMSLQVSWKIHQTLIRPRFKDLFDLTHLVKHPAFDQKALDDALQALVNECYADGISSNKIERFLYFDIGNLFPNYSLIETWDYWRNDIKKDIFVRNISDIGQAADITNINKLPLNLSVFLEQFERQMKKAGFTSKLFLNLPKATRFRSRSTTTDHEPETEAYPPDTLSPNGLMEFLKRWFK
jgi:hypothetical protein